MLISIHTPVRGYQNPSEDLVPAQVLYEAQCEALENQTNKDFEWVVCDDCYDMEPIEPVHTSFPHKLVRISKREPGWGKGLSMNACMKWCSWDVPYWMLLDVDWLLEPQAVMATAAHVGQNVEVKGYKIEANGGKYRFGELCCMPLTVMRSAGGWDEIFFPWYHDWCDWRRRALMVREMRVVYVEDFCAVDADKHVKRKISDVYDIKPIADMLKEYGNKLPILSGMFSSEIVYEGGY
jgi:hypothetical protein